MDISNLAVADTAEIHVKDTAGNPLYDDGKPVKIVIYGPGSQQFSVVDTRQSNRAIKRMNDNEGKITAATAEERLIETAEDLADVTVRFENLTNGEKTGRELFVSVYANPKLGYITRQVAKALADWGNFLAASKAA